MEFYKDIIGYEGLYAVSNFGNIKSLQRLVKRKNSTITINEKVLKPFISSTGYYSVTLVKAGVKTKVKNHRIVAKTFLDNPNNLPEVNHKNRNKLDNSIDNLEWVSSRENSCHAIDLKKKSSKYKGVSFCKQTKKWKSDIVYRKKRITIGRYAIEKDAFDARLEFEKKHNINNKYIAS